jgi:hypothetical protein
MKTDFPPTTILIFLDATKIKIETGRRMGFSVYNLYNRKNAASINFRQNADSGNNEGKTSIWNSSRSQLQF